MPSKAKPRRTPMTEPSANNENLGDHDPRNLFTSDGRKLEDSEFVGSPAPDTDAESEHPPEPRR